MQSTGRKFSLVSKSLVYNFTVISPVAYKCFFLTWLLGLMMMLLLLQLLCNNLGDIFPTNVNALDEHTTTLIDANFKIVHDCTNLAISLVRVSLWL